jgi:hypothetical protein
MANEHRLEHDSPMAESQPVELQNMRMLLEEARVLIALRAVFDL